jgi:hypothetical protein
MVCLPPRTPVRGYEGACAKQHRVKVLKTYCYGDQADHFTRSERPNPLAAA